MSNFLRALPQFLSSTLDRRQGLALLFASAVAAAALSAPGSALAEDKKTVKVGIISGEDEDVWRVVTAQAAEKGLKVETVVFNDYTQPNEALERGEIDANAFQHKPYLDNQIKTQGYHIVPVGYTGVWPIGLYSRKFTKVADLPEGAVIGVPNDPSNEGRALRVLQNEGVIKLKDGVGFKPTVADITANPKKLKIIEIEAAQTPRSLDDVAAAAINTNYAVDAKIDPASAILREDAKGPYVNIIAVRSADKDKSWVKALLAAYHTPEVKAFVAERFKGAVLASW